LSSGLVLSLWWRQNFHPEPLCYRHHSRNVLLLFLSERADCLKETLEAGRCDDAHESPRSLAEIAVGVRDAAWGKNGRALTGNKALAINSELIFPFENLERLIFAMVYVRGRASARHVMRFNGADHSAGVTSVDANDHRNAQDVNFLAAATGDLDWLHL